MFDNAGEKVRGLARVSFVLQLIVAGISVIGLLFAGQLLTAILSAALFALSAWISAVVMMAIGDAADYAERSTKNTYEIMHRLDRLLQNMPDNTGYQNVQQNLAAGYPDGKIPAWKQVQIDQENQQNQ